MNNKDWKTIWEKRVEAPVKMTHNDLLVANGYDKERSCIYSWNLAYAQDHYWKMIKLSPDESVYEVGCGSGAFLYHLYNDRYKVGGLDLSSNLIELAKINFPGSQFTQGEAINLNIEDKWDHVLSFGLFLYFPKMEYAEQVLLKMLEKANKTVSLYDLPNAELKDESESMRRATTPNYDEDYAGLQHLYFSKTWFLEFARNHKLHCTVFDQVVPNYENGKYRFCVVLNKMIQM